MRRAHQAHLRDFEERHHVPEQRERGRERRTWLVIAITAAMMVLEIAAGLWTSSIALLADGVHMATHVGALGITALAYWFARTRAGDPNYSFGTGKVYALAGYSSALALAAASLWMIVESVDRLLHPHAIRFDEALGVAVLGLVVNLVSAKLLHESGLELHDHDHEHVHGHEHDHGHEHEHAHDHAHRDAPGRPAEGGAHQDHNLRAAYLHVLADALTSLFAIVALLGGRLLGYGFLDAVVGIVGALVILRWAWGLTRSSARQLLDAAPSAKLVAGLREHLEQIDDVSVADLHLWEIAPGHRTCIVTIVTSTPRPTEFYRRAVRSRVDVDHLTVEVRRCGCVDDEPAPA